MCMRKETTLCQHPHQNKHKTPHNSELTLYPRPCRLGPQQPRGRQPEAAAQPRACRLEQRQQHHHHQHHNQQQQQQHQARRGIVGAVDAESAQAGERVCAARRCAHASPRPARSRSVLFA
eukprot:3754450-Rhodomonas_salina.5